MNNYAKEKEKAEKKRDQIIEIMQRYTQEMEQGHWYSSNCGIPEDRYEDVANDIINELE